jgi:hypothetical protein
MTATAGSPNAVSGFIQLRASQVSDTSARFPKAAWSSATSLRHWLAIRSNQSRRPLYRTYEDGWSFVSNSYAPTRTLAAGTIYGLRCIENSHVQDTLLPSRLRRRLQLSPMLGGM